MADPTISYPVLSSRRTAAANSLLALVLIPLVYGLFYNSSGAARLIRIPILLALLLLLGLGVRLLMRPKLLMEVSSKGLYVARTHIDWRNITMLEVTRNAAGRYLFVVIEPAIAGHTRFHLSERLSSVKIPALVEIIQTYHPVQVKIR